VCRWQLATGAGCPGLIVLRSVRTADTAVAHKGKERLQSPVCQGRVGPVFERFPESAMTFCRGTCPVLFWITDEVE
jgi:hypothetical protein